MEFNKAHQFAGGSHILHNECKTAGKIVPGVAETTGSGSTSLTNTAVIGIGRYIVPDEANNRSASTANRFDQNDLGDFANFILPHAAGHTQRPGGGTVLEPTSPGKPVRLAYAGRVPALFSGTVAVGDEVCVADLSSVANVIGTFNKTGNVSAANGFIVGTSVHPVVGRVVGPLPATNGTPTTPQLGWVVLYAEAGARRVTSA